MSDEARSISKTLNASAFEDYLCTQQSKLPVLPNVEKVSNRVIRLLGGNPGKFQLQGTNTFIVGTGSSRILVDTGQGLPFWTKTLADTLRTENITLSCVLLTHWHGDHTGGVPDLLTLYPYLSQSIYKNSPDKGQVDIYDGQVFSVEGATVRAVHTPGHSNDHMCFVLEEESAIFTGDNVLGHGYTAVEDLGLYMDSLYVMQGQACAIGYPGHGVNIINMPAKLEQYLNQKLRRERQILLALKNVKERERKEGKGGKGSVTVNELVTSIHGDALDPQVCKTILEPFMDEVLCKLASDGRVGFELCARKKRWFVHNQAA
ncbi:hypothetical protein MMC25_001106 [Agyrium rufum]|nr:hypothetical protein [Agyrium rufum]